MILRSLADARGGPLYQLWVRIPVERHGQINMRIYPTAASETDVHGVVGVTATRPDGREVAWSVALDMGPASAKVSGTVEVEQADGSFDTVFEESSPVPSAGETAALIDHLAQRVAATGTVWLE